MLANNHIAMKSRNPQQKFLNLGVGGSLVGRIRNVQVFCCSLQKQSLLNCFGLYTAEEELEVLPRISRKSNIVTSTIF